MISVVIATYNGKDYLLSQLDSIANQTIKPDEIIIIDDFSQEPCDDLIAQFISNSEIVVKYFKHKHNQGYASTFFEAILSAAGDYIFFADQDDIWNFNKIHEYMSVFEANPQVDCLSSKNILIDSKNEEIGREKIGNKKIEIVDIRKLVSQKSLRPGMSLAIRQNIVEKLRELDLSLFHQHDRLIELIACNNNSFYIINEYLTQYRLHDKNTSGMNRSFRPRIGLVDRTKKAESELLYLETVKQNLELNNRTLNVISSQMLFYKTRIEYLSKRSLFGYLFKMIPYYKNANGLRMIAGDINSIIKG